MKLFLLLYIYYNSLPRIDYIVTVVNWYARCQDLYLLGRQITLYILSLPFPLYSLFKLPILPIAYLDIRKVLDLYFMISASVNQ
jgi:hypothetical protein